VHAEAKAAPALAGARDGAVRPPAGARDLALPVSGSGARALGMGKKLARQAWGRT
jgi:hypothetical protein